MWLQAFVFLAAVGVCLTCAAAGVIGWLRQHNRIAVLSGAAGASVVLLYAAVLIGAGLRSGAVELRLGEEKHICELDCHLAYAVTGVERSSNRFVVKLRKRFDENTISEHRGNSVLTPGPRRIVLQDPAGRHFRLLTSTGMSVELRPGESNEITLTFEVPAGAHPTQLRIEDADPVKQLLIGSETAPLHKRVVFDVG